MTVYSIDGMTRDGAVWHFGCLHVQNMAVAGSVWSGAGAAAAGAAGVRLASRVARSSLGRFSNASIMGCGNAEAGSPN